MHTKDATPAHHLRIKQTIIWSLCLLLWAASMAEARDRQEPPAPGAILKVTSEVVNVYAVVRKHGRLISNLDKDDFRLEEDNKPQVIRYFARAADAPLAMGILVDTSPSQDRVLEVEKTEARAFLQEVMRPKDRTFVLRFDVEVELLRDLTSDLRVPSKSEADEA
jgi:VWFA-related protein